MTFIRVKSISKIKICNAINVFKHSNCTINTKLEVKNIKDVPSSAYPIPIFGTLHQYFPLIGKYDSTKMHHANMMKYKKHGPIVQETFTSADPPLLNLFHPEDFETLFRSEAENPSRLSHLALQEYRLRKSDKYDSGGLLPTNGAEWWHLRKSFQKGLSSPKSVLTYLPMADSLTMEWINSLKWNLYGDNNISQDLLVNLWEIFLDIAGMVLFNHRFNAFTFNLDKAKAMKLVESALVTNHNVVLTDIGFKLWKQFNTPSYTKLKKAQDYMENLTCDLLNHCKKEVEGTSLVTNWAKLTEVNQKDILGMAMDFLLAGIDTSSNTSSFLLYYVSSHPEIQAKLYEEAYKFLPNTSSVVTEEILHEVKFAKAVLKETLRLRPISIGIGRLLTKDTIIRGYEIPKGINVLTNNQVACRIEQHFHNPMSFIPERWIRNDPLFRQPHPFLLLPFGFGARACIARRLAEQNMLVLLLKVVRNFNLKWEGPALDSESHLIQKPDRPITIKFTKR